MTALETLTLAPIAIGALAILRFVWVDSLRFTDFAGERSDAEVAEVSRGTRRRLALRAEAERVQADTENLPRAA
jgi:hypothetical protein